MSLESQPKTKIKQRNAPAILLAHRKRCVNLEHVFQSNAQPIPIALDVKDVPTKVVLAVA